MNKNDLRLLLSILEPGHTVAIQFLNDHKPLSGTYKVLTSKVGRGKGGSRVFSGRNTVTGAVLSALTINGKTVALGTPCSDEFLNVTTGDNVVHGCAMEIDATTRVFPRNEENAKKLMTAMEPYLGKEGFRIMVHSTEPMFAGEWVVEGSKRNPGRFGQLSFFLRSAKDKTRTVEFWTYRHSGVVTSIDVDE